MSNRNKKVIIILFVYLIAIILFTFFSKTVSFHDTYEYITLTKEFAGISNINVYTTHSLIYPFFVGQILKFFPSFFTIKFLSSIWLFLNGLLIYLYSRNKKALLIWMLSPLSWFMSIQYIPILPASFFILLGYILFKKYEEKNSKFYFIISALSMGFSIIIYFPAIAVVTFFMISFMFKKKFYFPFLYMVLMLISFLPEIILNYIFFNFPFYSFVRYFGINALVILGKSFEVKFIYLYWLLVPFAISPLLYKILKLKFKNYKRELIFVTLLILFFAIRGGSINYFLLFSPILILLISQKVNEKEIYISSIISIVLIIFMTHSYFGYTMDEKITNDLNKIKLEYPNNKFLTSNNRANALATFSWSDYPKFIWLWEYELEKSNKNTTSEYEIRSKPSISSDKTLVLNARLDKSNNIKFGSDIYLIAVKGDKVPGGFYLVKEYNVLNIYKAFNL